MSHAVHTSGRSMVGLLSGDAVQNSHASERNEHRVAGWIIVLSASATLWSVIGGGVWLIAKIAI